MGQPKRVWSNKKTVWDGKKSVWLQDGELKTYDGNREDAGSDLQTYGSQWEEVSDDAILDVYDSNTPEPIGTPEDGIKATYTFKDYDGTVLKTGTVDDGGTPVAPTDPTREHYTFQGWNPTVGPISKNTEYVAVYTPVNYTVTIATNDATYGTVSPTSVTAPYGTSISASDNVLTIGETTVTATAESGYVFSSWGTLPETVTENLTITAAFVVDVSVEIITELSNTTGVVGGFVDIYYNVTGTPGILYSDSPDILSVDTVEDIESAGGITLRRVTCTVNSAGATAFTITANGTVSDSIEITCSNQNTNFPNGVLYTVDDVNLDGSELVFKAWEFATLDNNTNSVACENDSNPYNANSTACRYNGAASGNSKFMRLNRNGTFFNMIKESVEELATTYNLDLTTDTYAFTFVPRVWSLLQDFIVNAGPTDYQSYLAAINEILESNDTILAYEAPTPSVPTLVNSVMYNYAGEVGTIFEDNGSYVQFEGTQPASLTLTFVGDTDNARVKQMFGVGEASMNLQNFVMSSINKIDEDADNEYSDEGGAYNYQFTSNAWTAIQTFMASDGGEQAIAALCIALYTEYNANGNSILTMIS